MPQVLNQLDAVEIVRELRSRGYGIDTCRGYAFRLSVRSKTQLRKSTGTGIFEPIGGVTPRQWLQIRTTSRDVVHAADRVESLAHGRTQTVDETEDRPGAAGPSVDTILKAVDNRIDNKLQPILGLLTQIQQALTSRDRDKDQDKQNDQPESVAGVSAESILAGAELPASAFEEETPVMVTESQKTELAKIAAQPTPPPPRRRGWPKGKPRKPKADGAK